MKRYIVAMLLACVGMLSASAQLLWKVEREGSDKVSYVLGTHHFAPNSILDSIPMLDDALNNVECLYGELDMAQMGDMGAIMEMQNMMVAPPDSVLSMVLSQQTYMGLDSLWNVYIGPAMPLKLVDRLKPAAIMAQMEGAIATKNLSNFTPSDNIDLVMQTRARAIGKLVKGLETTRQQMEMLMCSPISEQADDLTEHISHIDENIEKITLLTDAYMSQDFDTLSQLIDMGNEEDPQSADKLIYKRNEAWTHQLKDEMLERSIMVVVGAGHLPGDRGLLNLLKQAEYKITPAH